MKELDHISELWVEQYVIFWCQTIGPQSAHEPPAHTGNVAAQTPGGPGALIGMEMLSTHGAVGSAAGWFSRDSVVLLLFFHLSLFSSVDRFKNGQGSGLDGGQYRVYINGTLEIKRARPEDEGTYTCVASSMLGTAENQVRLEVKGQSPWLDSTCSSVQV